MSTKTTFKRVALATVAALGFGVLTSVAPATAADGRTALSISVDTTKSFTRGVVNIIPITVTFPTTNVAGDTTTITAEVLAAPLTGGVSNAPSLLGPGVSNTAANGDGASTSAATTARLYFATDAVGTSPNATLEASTAAADAAIADGKTQFGGLVVGELGISDDAAGPLAAAVSVASTVTGASTATVYLAVKPDLAGSFSILIASNATGRTYFVSGDTRTTATFTTSGTVASVALSALNTSIVGANPLGVIMRATLKDAAGGLTNLGAADQIVFSSSNSTDTFYQCSDAGCTAALTNGVATSGMFVNGVGYFKVSSAATADATSVVTATTDILGGTNTSTTVSASFKKLVALGATEVLNEMTQGLGSTVAGYDGTPSQTAAWDMLVTSTATSSAVKYTFGAAAAAAGVFGVKITDTSKAILGTDTKAALEWTSAVSYAAAATSASLSVTHAALGNNVLSYAVTASTASTTVQGIDATAAVVTVKGATAALTGTNTVTATPAGPIAAAAKGTVPLTATVTNRFGVAIANAAVSVSVAGRNTVAATSKLTDADGNITFSYTDAGTISANDVVTFSYNNGSTTATDTVTITYGGAAVSTVSVTSSNTTLGVAKATVTPLSISAGDGVEAGAVDVTATIKDASGNLLIGVPVTWTITGGTGAAVSTTKATTYSSSLGVATASIYAWVAGTYTVTATAGTVSGTGTTTWASQTAGNARVLSASVDGNVVTAKVVDRFGNPVKGVTVYATKSGTGYFGSGLSRTDGVTLADGTIQFGITGGNASVTVSTLNPVDPAGTNAAGQTCALAGNRTCASGATAAVAFTATVAGTSLVDATYVGATFAPAGVSSATVEVTDGASSAAQAAADAAAEATDAANAATDAANAAAEAADAATAAAQDAADAVAALSTQVSEMVNALKKQITALTNLVIKIQKKVRA
jgi:hypothetical protein